MKTTILATLALGSVIAVSAQHDLPAGNWGQCFGESYTGPTECNQGWKCVVINQWYGQCLQDTTTTPAITTTITPPTTTTSSPTGSPTCPTLCIDYVNECGKWYGGCVPHCPGEALPTFPAPPCTTTLKSTTILTTSTTLKPTTTTKPATTTLNPSSSPTITACPIACFDYINPCRVWYGGCTPYCPGDPFPTWPAPPCTATSTTVPKPSSTSSSSLARRTAAPRPTAPVAMRYRYM